MIDDIEKNKNTETGIYIKDIIKHVNGKSYSEKNIEMRKWFDFVRCFKSKGVYGIVGLLRLKRNDRLVFFKISTDYSNNIKHEYNVLESLSDDGFPHFCKLYGCMDINLSTDFIRKPYRFSIFHESDETLPKTIMLTEVVNKTTFHRVSHVCDKNILVSLILQVLVCLEIAQRKCDFTHYDLHTSNILVQDCEYDLVIVYDVLGVKLAIPTYGKYIKIIDTGISYSKSVDGGQMFCNTDNNDHGFQTTVFDRLCDSHHFLVSALYSIEDKSDGYSSLFNKIKIIFRRLPILKKSGWKKLPVDVTKNLIHRIREDCLEYKKYDIFRENSRNTIEILNGLITLPHRYSDYGNTFDNCFTPFMEEFSSMINVENFSEHDSLFTLDCIVKNIVKYRDDYNNIESFKKSVVLDISTVINDGINFDVDYEKILLSGIVLSGVLESNYKELISENVNYINGLYGETHVKSPIDLVRYISRNMTPSYTADKNTLFYIISDRGTIKKNITDENILSRVNKCSFLERYNYIL